MTEGTTSPREGQVYYIWRKKTGQIQEMVKYLHSKGNAKLSVSCARTRQYYVNLSSLYFQPSSVPDAHNRNECTTTLTAFFTATDVFCQVPNARCVARIVAARIADGVLGDVSQSRALQACRSLVRAIVVSSEGNVACMRVDPERDEVMNHLHDLPVS